MYVCDMFVCVGFMNKILFYSNKGGIVPKSTLEDIFWGFHANSVCIWMAIYMVYSLSLGVFFVVVIIHLQEAIHKINGRRKKTCLPGLANKKDAYQPARPCRLISAFVIRFLESIMSRFATSKISNF